MTLRVSVCGSPNYSSKSIVLGVREILYVSLFCMSSYTIRRNKIYLERWYFYLSSPPILFSRYKSSGIMGSILKPYKSLYFLQQKPHILVTLCICFHHSPPQERLSFGSLPRISASYLLSSLNQPWSYLLQTSNVMVFFPPQ